MLKNCFSILFKKLTLFKKKKRFSIFFKRFSRTPSLWKAKRRFTATVMLCPADRVSSGNISLGTVRPSGHRHHPIAITKRQVTINTNTEWPFESLSLPLNLSPGLWQPSPVHHARVGKMEELYGGRSRNESAFWMCIWQMNIWIPPEISKAEE